MLLEIHTLCFLASFTALLRDGVALDNNFDWLRVLKFRMDIRNVLRAKTTTTVAEAKTSQTPAKGTPRRGRLKKQAEGQFQVHVWTVQHAVIKNFYLKTMTDC